LAQGFGLGFLGGVLKVNLGVLSKKGWTLVVPWGGNKLPGGNYQFGGGKSLEYKFPKQLFGGLG